MIVIFPKRFFDELVRDHPSFAVIFLLCGATLFGFAVWLVFWG
jgi:hypothetical protein